MCSMSVYHSIRSAVQPTITVIEHAENRDGLVVVDLTNDEVPEHIHPASDRNSGQVCVPFFTAKKNNVIV